ncbi:hypothetical protein [Thalassotalea sp. PP2-459]|uniref:hypothetical protein n=1 Tax=Thalassotalea sp. PP2-459 TaxID=1742724 RepID=UPI000944DBFC|nr:hypothetical protein [Thalassotalea sp. PP2-459]OKY25652.1 hypothetical protein BI291_15595 [Thalassotalea sp. PP2-459]
MTPFEVLGNATKAVGQLMLDIIMNTDPNDCECDTESSVDDFSNSARFNAEGDVVTDLEGKNAPKHGGLWMRFKD